MDESVFHIGVKALIENASGEVLLLHRPADTSPEPKWKEYWDIPGGRIKEGGGIIDTVQREVEEEIGVTPTTVGELFDAGLSRITINSKQGKVRLFLLIYLCKIPKTMKLQLSKEHYEYRWVDRNTAGNLLGKFFPISFIEKLRQ